MPSAWCIGAAVLLVAAAIVQAEDQLAAPKNCAELMNSIETIDENDLEGMKQIFLCQLHKSATMMQQLSELVHDGVEGLLDANDLNPDPEVVKRKHEYLRFGKRKHEYLRFGKRKHEYLRFGKRKHEYLRFGKRKHEYLRFGKK